ncbi:MAG: penicillin acylase family protein, partial [Balneolaceae bacterium]
MRILFRIGLLLSVLIAGIAILAIYWTFYKPLPDYGATLRLEGLEESVEVHWDPYGVPHIYASRERDLYYTIGYLHAQDRLWQMTLTQLAAEGRFAEFLGEELVPLDRHQRTLGFWETANRIEEEAPDEIHQLLLAYSEGVNEYVARNRRNLPIEFTLTGIEPIPWTPTHSYALSRLMAWEMNVSWWSEIAYGTLYERLPGQILQELIPEYSDQFPTTMDEEQSAGFAQSLLPMIETEEMIRSRFQKRGTSVGSNAWAVDGSRTESGLPILAGDPHMSLNMPGRWYEVHVNLFGRNLSGATLPGAPIVVLGQNDELAWSLTNMMSDDTDFFLELENPDDPGQYVSDSLNGEAIYESYEIRNEILRVKEKDDQLFQIRITENGPVISDIYPNPGLTGDSQITMKWTGHEVSHEMWAMYRINWAESLDQFRSALADFHSPGQNFIYADRSGNIAHFSAGRLPVRDHHPLLFRNGWDPSYDWQGWIPFDEMPRVLNPSTGYVANANNKLHTDSYPHYIATFWEPPSRIQRIENLLMEQDTLSSEWFQQMQLDDYSIHAQEITEIILPILRSSGNEYDFSQVIPYLENW